MKYAVSIDVPDLEEGIRFYGEAFGFTETARPFESYAVLRNGDAEIGIVAKAAGTKPAPGADDLRRYERHWTPVHMDFYAADFDAALESALQAGALCEQKFEGGAHPPVAFLSDPFGNGFCLIGRN